MFVVLLNVCGQGRNGCSAVSSTTKHTLNENISALLTASDAKQSWASSQSRTACCSHIRDFQQHNFLITLGYWGLGSGTKSAYLFLSYNRFPWRTGNNALWRLILQINENLRAQDFYKTRMLALKLLHQILNKISWIFFLDLYFLCYRIFLVQICKFHVRVNKGKYLKSIRLLCYLVNAVRNKTCTSIYSKA